MPEENVVEDPDLEANDPVYPTLAYLLRHRHITEKRIHSKPQREDIPHKNNLVKTCCE